MNESKKKDPRCWILWEKSGAIGTTKKFVKQVVQKVKIKTIGKLSVMPNPSIYGRTIGGLYLKLNERFHVKVKLDGKSWVGDGMAEEFDPNENVRVIQ